VATARRKRTLAVPQQQLWELLADPHHMPRWWPGVDRMEGVEDDRFTQVFKTKRGRPVRAGLPGGHVRSTVDAKLGPGGRRHAV